MLTPCPTCFGAYGDADEDGEGVTGGGGGGGGGDGDGPLASCKLKMLTGATEESVYPTARFGESFDDPR